MKISDDLIALTSKLMLAHEKSEVVNLAAEFSAVIGKLIEAEKRGTQYTTPQKSVTATLKFTTKEISKMETNFKKHFILNGLVAHVTKRASGKNSWCYEIRYRSDGYNISASSTDLGIAKRKFLRMTEPDEIEKYKISPDSFPTKNFGAFADYYFEKFYKIKVVSATYKNTLNRYRHYLFPAFGNKEIKKITPSDCQTLLDGITAQGKGKTADEVYSILSILFKGAIAHGLIDRSPLGIVVYRQHEKKHGVALTKEEEKQLLDALAGTKYQLLIAVALYTGLRPNEYATAKIEGPFIVAMNSKRKNRKIEYKKIPITSMLRPYLEGVRELHYPMVHYVRDKFNEILPNHILYDLRTTFYTRCMECGVAEPALKEFVGHSFGVLGDAYTDLSDEYLLKEGEKLCY